MTAEMLFYATMGLIIVALVGCVIAWLFEDKGDDDMRYRVDRKYRVDRRTVDSDKGDDDE